VDRSARVAYHECSPGYPATQFTYGIAQLRVIFAAEKMRSNHALEIAAARAPIAVSSRSASGHWTPATLIVLVSWLWSVASAAADDAASLRMLADAARTTLAERIEPPASRIPFLCTVGRTETAPIREYILRQQAAAIDALVASARGPDEVRRVRRMLGELERDGYSRSADAYLADTAPCGGPLARAVPTATLTCSLAYQMFACVIARPDIPVTPDIPDTIHAKS